MKAQNKSYIYLLGDSQKESSRLRHQSRLWDPVTRDLFDRLEIKPGWKVLEIGPGQGSLHLELRTRVNGPIDAVEQSPSFSSRLQKLCNRDKLGQGKIWTSKLNETPLPSGYYDLVFARWVFLFLPNPLFHVRKLVKSLKPGGILAIQDYHRETFSMIPKPSEWQDFIKADQSFFASQGGDCSIGNSLPQLFKQAGLKIMEVHPTLKSGSSRSPTWKWVTDYALEVMDRYAEFPPFSKQKARQLRKKWIHASHQPDSLIIAPTLLDVVGRKPR